MLTKVFKVEFRSLIRLTAGASAGAVLLGAISCLCSILCIKTIAADTALSFFIGSFGTICTIGSVVLCILGGFCIFYRYYKTMFTDEGYLTMVLPVETHHLLIGKMLASLLCAAIVIVGLILSSTLFSTIPVLVSMMPIMGANGWKEILNALIEQFVAQNAGIESVLETVNNGLMLLDNFLLAFAAITLGGCIFRKHKILGTVLFAYLISMVETAVSAGLSFLSMAMDIPSVWTLWITVPVFVGAAVGTYYLTWWLIDKRFNIE